MYRRRERWGNEEGFSCEITMLRPAVWSRRLRNLSPENPMNVIHYIGLDVHKKTISYCIKTADGRIVREGETAGVALNASKLGGKLAGAVVRGDGSHAVQCLDLRHPQALRTTAGDGASGEDEGHHCRRKRRAIRSMHGPSRTCCAAICCPPAMCCRRRCAISGGCCGIAIWWSSSRYGCRTRWLVC